LGQLFQLLSISYVCDIIKDPETGERKMLVKFTCLQKGSDSGNGPRINSGYAVGKLPF